MNQIELEKEIIRYKSLIKLHEAMLYNAKRRIERSIQKNIIQDCEVILSKLMNMR